MLNVKKYLIERFLKKMIDNYLKMYLIKMFLCDLKKTIKKVLY